MRQRTLIMASAAVAAASLLVAGCGGGSSTPAAGTGHNGLVVYSDCMRSHGLPTFPDPTASGGIPKNKIPIGNPRFVTASNDCQRVMPAGGLGPQTTPEQTRAHVVDEIAFARCLRAHGFASFPDPTASGQLTHEMLANAGINLHQPAVLQAADGCAGVTHGVITKAAVARFVAGQ